MSHNRGTSSSKNTSLMNNKLTSSGSEPISMSRQQSVDQSSSDGGLNCSMSKDDAYRERRRKNNEAAKRSRDARRAKEDDIALRAAILERENLQLKVEVAQLKQETSKLRCLLYNS